MKQLMLKGLCCLLVLLVVSGCDARNADPDQQKSPDPVTLRKTQYGKVVGFSGSYGAHVWLGIPYAKPPVGELRWRKPEKPEAWSHTREALHFGNHCPQTANRSGGISSLETGTPTGDEDCLYLNIWAPQFKSTEIPTSSRRLPVMVWIHGGGNEIGSGSLYNGGNLAATHRLLVVTLNYRLGPFGWFSHKSVTGEADNPQDQSGNFGTLDLIQALHWVKTNIAAFGGDPGNVTVFGQSAGGYNIYSLLVSPYAQDLFHKAIIQSGGNSFSKMDDAEAYRAGVKTSHKVSSAEALVRLIIADGRAEDPESAFAVLDKMSSSETASYLRSKNRDEVLNAFKGWGKDGDLQPRVRVYSNLMDGKVLPREDPVNRLQNPENYHEVPVILGSNRDEQKLYMVFDPDYVNSYLGVIYRIRDPEVYERDVAYMSDAWKLRGVDRAASAMGRSSSKGVFAYRFDWDEEPDFIITDFGEVLGAAHGFEIPFVFGHFDLGSRLANLMISANDEGRYELSKVMMSYWAEFAYTGNPRRGRLFDQPLWKGWDNTPGKEKMMLFDTPEGGGVRMSNEVVTFDSLVSRIEQDNTLSTREEKCRMFVRLFYNRFEWNRETYNSLGDSGCSRYKPEDLRR